MNRRTFVKNTGALTVTSLGLTLAISKEILQKKTMLITAITSMRKVIF